MTSYELQRRSRAFNRPIGGPMRLSMTKLKLYLVISKQFDDPGQKAHIVTILSREILGIWYLRHHMSCRGGQGLSVDLLVALRASV